MSLKDYRNNLGLTQSQVAEKAGIGLQHVSNIETKRTSCRLRVAIKISDAIGYELGAGELIKLAPFAEFMPFSRAKRLAKVLNVPIDKEGLF